MNIQFEKLIEQLKRTLGYLPVRSGKANKNLKEIEKYYAGMTAEQISQYKEHIKE